jgi:hypothetical protein
VNFDEIWTWLPIVAPFRKDVVMTGTRSCSFSEDLKKLSISRWVFRFGQIWSKRNTFLEGTVYSGNGYAEFAISGTKSRSNIAWLISPKLTWMFIRKSLTFLEAQHHLDVDSPLNSLEVYVSSNFWRIEFCYCDLTPLVVNLRNKPHMVSIYRKWRRRLSSYKGKINIAFKYTGSGKNLALDGAFQ